IIIDLAGVDYISSAGWGIFISSIREIRANNGDIN
nr:STAS domain-containing protein [Desulfobacterales bacterium]